MAVSPVDDGDKLTSNIVALPQRNEVHQFMWTAGAFCILIALWTSLRVYSRSIRQMHLGLEDLLYNISVAAFYGFIVALFLALYLGGAGYHMSQLTKYHVARLTQSFLAIETLYGVSMCTVKWSMLFMLKRIFDVPYFRIATWIIIIMQTGWLIMTVLIGFLICRPVAKNWDPTVVGSCGNRVAGYTAVSAVNVVIDCLIFILPLPMIFKLHVRTGYKAGLFAIFSIGIVSIIFSVIRLISLNSMNFDDFAYTVIHVMIWTTAEVGVIIMVASSALLQPVFDKMFSGILSLSGSKNNSRPSQRHINSKSKMGSRSRKDFVAVGDGTESDDFMELGHVGPQTEISTNTRDSYGATTTDRLAAHEDGLNGGMKILVKSQVTQTYDENQAEKA